MNDFKISRKLANTLDDANLAWAVIEPIWKIVPIEKGWRAVSSFFESTSPGQRDLFAIDWCQKEIRNGGLDQYFYNSNSMLAQEALSGFRKIGAFNYAQILEESFGAFPRKQVPRSRPWRQFFLMLPRFSDFDLDDLSRRFCQLLRTDDLEPYRGCFVREHPEEFFHD